MHLVAKACHMRQTYCMAREEIEPLSFDEMRSFMARIERVSAAFAFADTQVSKGETVYVFRKPSLRLGIDRLEAFAKELERSIAAKMAGEPFGPDTEKGRKTITAPKKSARKKR